MNLHEECLLKYLLNPISLSDSTELLKSNVLLYQQKEKNKIFFDEYKKINLIQI